MAKLQIHVFNIGGNTVSKFEVTNTEKVVFFNHGTDLLTVVVKDSPMPGPVLCGKRNDKLPVTEPITITTSEKKKDFFICDSYQGESFTYSAEIKGAAIEDPIVIIEKGSYLGSIAANGPVFAGGVGAGVVLTILVVTLVKSFRPT